MVTNGYIQAKLNNKQDLDDFIFLYEGSTGGEPMSIDPDSLFIEINVFSYGDREVFKEFLRERNAEILADEIDDGDN